MLMAGPPPPSRPLHDDVQSAPKLAVRDLHALPPLDGLGEGVEPARAAGVPRPGHRLERRRPGRDALGADGELAERRLEVIAQRMPRAPERGLSGHPEHGRLRRRELELRQEAGTCVDCVGAPLVEHLDEVDRESEPAQVALVARPLFLPGLRRARELVRKRLVHVFASRGFPAGEEPRRELEQAFLGATGTRRLTGHAPPECTPTGRRPACARPFLVPWDT